MVNKFDVLSVFYYVLNIWQTALTITLYRRAPERWKPTASLYDAKTMYDDAAYADKQNLVVFAQFV